MRMRCTLAWVVVVCFTLLATPRVSIHAGETGVVAGQVTDAETGEPLAGVPVVLQGSNRGTVTDAEGHYYLLGVPPGIYTLVYTYVGYRRADVSDVHIEGGQSLEMDMELHPTAFQMEPMVVTAGRDIAKARMDIPATTMIMTRETLREAPVATVMEAIAQDPGG